MWNLLRYYSCVVLLFIAPEGLGNTDVVSVWFVSWLINIIIGPPVGLGTTDAVSVLLLLLIVPVDWEKTDVESVKIFFLRCIIISEAVSER